MHSLRLLILLPLPLLLAITGLAYATFCLPSGPIGGTLALLILYALALYLLLRLAGIGQYPLRYWWPLLPLLWLVPIFHGHYNALQDTRRHVDSWIDAAPTEYPSEWQAMDRDARLLAYNRHLGGDAESAWWAYLQLSTRIGWSGYERTTYGPTLHVERTGIMIWLVWLLHWGGFFLAVAGAVGALLPDTDETEARPVRRSVKKPIKRKPAPAAPRVQAVSPPPAQHAERLLRAQFEVLDEDHWLVTLRYMGRQESFRYPRMDDQPPTTRELVADLSFRCYQPPRPPPGHEAFINHPDLAPIFSEAEDLELKMRRLLGEKDYWSFINDDRFLIGSVEDDRHA